MEFVKIKENFPYEVSANGDVRNINTGYLKKPQLSQYGYHRVLLCHRGATTKKYVHRLVCDAFLPNPENKPQVNHLDGRKTNNNVLNLEWCTSKENINHAYDIGLIVNANGSNHGLSKLIESQVKEIRIMLENRVPQRQIAKQYKVTQGTICAISVGRTWSHLV